MTGAPYARLHVSKVALLLGLALLAFGVYTVVTYFRSGGRGHGTTMLRGLVAIPLGCVVVYLSFSRVCSSCNERLPRGPGREGGQHPRVEAAHSCGGDRRDAGGGRTAEPRPGR